MPRSTAWRPQPPSIADPEEGGAPLDYLGEDSESTSGMDTGDVVAEREERPGEESDIDWLKRAKDAFRFSTTYVDSNYRKKWEDSIRAFNNQHSSDSKYNTDLFRKRSNMFRPKTRSIIRKNEAAAASAFFSNLELTDVKALNESDKAQRASADVMKQLLQYRLTKSIPWFKLVTGGIQDAQAQGAVIAHVHWEFFEHYDKNGVVTARKDNPAIELIPIENFRIDPSASWLDPIGQSPYLIHLIPMFWGAVKERMEKADPKGRTWKKIRAEVAFGRTPNSDDSTRQARMGVQQDPAQQKREISDYDIVWVHRHIHRYEGKDWEFYTLNSERLLTDPAPLKDTVWHGERPYVLGNVILETHKTLPEPLPILVKALQDEANENINQRMDNVKFVLNKGYFVKRGKNVDIAALVRNVPGRVTMVDNVEEDVKEQTWGDVTQSAYAEQDRIDSDFNDLAGNFSPMQVQTARTPRESTHTMKMLQAPSNLLTEYMLLTYVKTFIEPVLRQLVMMEQHYETDITILTIAGQKAQIMQKYGVNEITDEMLNRELTLVVNVGMGATDPVMKLQKFSGAATTYAQIARLRPPGLDLKEVWKELASLSGYQDGTRFVTDGSDPQVAALQQENQMLKQKLMETSIKAKNKEDTNVVSLQKGREANATKLLLEHMKMTGQDGQNEVENRRILAQHIMSQDQGEREAKYNAEAAEQAHGFSMQQQAAKPKPNAA